MKDRGPAPRLGMSRHATSDQTAAHTPDACVRPSIRGVDRRSRWLVARALVFRGGGTGDAMRTQRQGQPAERRCERCVPDRGEAACQGLACCSSCAWRARRLMGVTGSICHWRPLSCLALTQRVAHVSASALMQPRPMLNISARSGTRPTSSRLAEKGSAREGLPAARRSKSMTPLARRSARGVRSCSTPRARSRAPLTSRSSASCPCSAGRSKAAGRKSAMAMRTHRGARKIRDRDVALYE